MATFEGTPSNDNYTGTDGDDTINGYNGDDKLAGGEGADTVNGGNGNNWIASYLLTYFQLGTFDRHFQSLDIYAEHDVLTGGTGSDVFEAGYGDSVDGGPGATVYATMNYLNVNLRGATAGVVADFYDIPTYGSLTIGGGVITNIGTTTNIVGSDFDDVIRPLGSTALFAWVYGGAGNDRLTSDEYTEFLDGGTGDDVLDGRAGGYLTQLNGGEGNDTFYLLPGSATASGGAGNDIFYTYNGSYGGDGDDKIYLQGAGGSNSGEAGNDEIRASDLGNRFEGGTGFDLLIGGAGNDFIYSDSSANQFAPGDTGLEYDVLTGGGGNDTLAIGYGDDADGGTGSNTLILSLAGATAGVTINIGSILTGPFTMGGGTIRNVQTVPIVWGSNFADTITLPTQSVTAIVHAGPGNDTIYGNNSTVLLYGDYGDDIVFGGSSGDTLYGGYGNDTLNGLTGADMMYGEAGNDSYYIDNAGDRVFENANEGSDTVYSDISFTLPANVETLFLMGTATINGTAGTGTASYTIYGNDVANVLTGGLAQDTLYGGGGNDRIDGRAGGDLMYGGGGDDTYVFDATNDYAFELADEGNDTVESSANLNLAVNLNVENGTLTGATAIQLIGNELDNVLTGNAANNVIQSGGGADRIDGGLGADTMSGGAGDDLFLVDNAGDMVVEAVGEGDDTIKASVDFSIVGMSNIEYLRITGSAARATGNAEKNVLVGNEGDNILDGGGGGDRMKGGYGNDTYIVRDASDIITEISDSGANDVVKAAVSYTLAAAAWIETLRTIDAAATTPIDLTGNAYSHVIEGNAGANVLTAGSGDDRLSGFGGNDTLIGGAGADVFVFDHNTGQDLVGDFVSGTDRLDLSAFFTSFGDVLAAASDVDGTVTIDLGNGVSVTLMGVPADQLQSGDVILGVAPAAPAMAVHGGYWWAEMVHGANLVG